MKNPDELIQYYIVNKDLNMSVSKIATQVAHVVTIISLNESKFPSFRYTRWEEWYNQGQKKIILKASEKKLKELIMIGFYHIKDFGLTEILGGSLTCVGSGVMTRVEAEPYIKRLQLL